MRTSGGKYFRSLYSTCCTLAFTLLLLLCHLGSTAGAETAYLGEACLALSGSQFDPGPFTLRVGVMSYGKDYYPLNGVLIDSHGSMVPAYGNALVQEESTTVSITSPSTLYVGFVMYKITLNTGTWSGWYEAMNVYQWNAGPPPDARANLLYRDSGDAALKPCP